MTDRPSKPWRSTISTRSTRAAIGEGRRQAAPGFIVTIDRSDDSTAFIKVRCQLWPHYFTDYLMGMKLKDGRQIFSKSYRYDLRE